MLFLFCVGQAGTWTVGQAGGVALLPLSCLCNILYVVPLFRSFSPQLRLLSSFLAPGIALGLPLYLPTTTPFSFFFCMIYLPPSPSICLLQVLGLCHFCLPPLHHTPFWFCPFCPFLNTFFWMNTGWTRRTFLSRARRARILPARTLRGWTHLRVLRACARARTS